MMQGAQLRKHIDATLGSGNLREAVRLPPGEDLNEWLAVNSNCSLSLSLSLPVCDLRITSSGTFFLPSSISYYSVDNEIVWYLKHCNIELNCCVILSLES
jgi:hypothetical protein